MQFSHHGSDRRHLLRTTQRARGEHGYVLTLFALLLVPLLLMVGFSVDVGYWYNRAADMQRAADAAALAGVVWLPDENAARTAALAAAKRNGFEPGGSISISVNRSTQNDRRLRVTISDSEVSSFFYNSLTGDEIDLSRTAFAEYVLSVPMGSPRNFIGTGTLLASYTAPGIPAEYLYQSVNPYCTDKVNGDRYQSGYDGGTCSGTVNSEYRTSGYTTVIEVPQNRTAAIDIGLYDARYSEAAVTWQEQTGTDCVDVPTYTPAAPSWTASGSTTNVTLRGPAEYQTRATTGSSWSSTQTLAAPNNTVTQPRNLIRFREAVKTWTPAANSWTTSTSSSNITINGYAEYQTRSSTSNSYGSTQYLQVGQSFTRARNLIRYRTATWPSTPVCTPVYTEFSEAGPDDYRQNGAEEYTYTLYAADNTPLDDSDNPVMCQQTFTATTPFEDVVYLGSRRWNYMCSIPTTGLPGRYLLRVHNQGQITDPEGDGSNQYGVVARYANASGDGLCDGRTDATCPRVYANDAMSVRAAASTTVASFYLAEIASEHAGKKMRLELFDPGEGGSSIQIMQPSGTDGNTWTPATFSWEGAASSGGTSGTNVTSIDVTSSRFNGKLITITIDLSGYNPPSNNKWWQIKYTFAGAVTDRTTWSARIIGDPVHLVEEY
jgi:hypothetical protein